MTKPHVGPGSLKKELCWLVAVSLGLAACGAAQPEVVKAPPPNKVVWNDSGSEPEAEPEASPEVGSSAAASASRPALRAQSRAAAPEAPPPAPAPQASSGGAEDEETDPNAIDLDALAAARAAPPAPAAPKGKAAPAPASKPAAAEPVARPAEEPEAKPEKKAEAEPAKKEAEQKTAKKADRKPAAEPGAANVATDPLALELQKRRAAAKARAEARAEEEGKARDPDARKNEAEAGEEPAASAYKGNDPCRASSFSVERVRVACASGGRAAAKRVMKDAIGKATATGQSLRCTNCHANQQDYTLKADAVADLKRWLD